MSELKREIVNGRMLKNNGSWMYCNACNKTVGYLCYTTYQDFDFKFECKCGNKGAFHLSYNTKELTSESSDKLKLIKNRLCCPKDDSPLFTIVEKNINKAFYKVTCKECNTSYEENKE